MEYTLMNQNIPTITIEIDDNGQIIKINKIHNLEYLPVGIATLKNLEKKELKIDNINAWWKSRSIPASREGIQNILEQQQIPSTSVLATKSLGLSLSDQYWIKPEDTEIEWKDVNFFTNTFTNEISLFDNSNLDKILGSKHPDITSDGYLPKKWKQEKNESYLIKAGSKPFYQEPYNEVIASKILKLWNLPHVEYALNIEGKRPVSICKNFITKDTELVTAYQIYNLTEKPNQENSFQHLCSNMELLGIPKYKNFLNNMLALDYLINNTDRHFRNFGVIRNVKTLKYEGFAPLFDHGNSLWYQSVEQEVGEVLPVKPFFEDRTRQINLVSSFDEIKLDNDVCEKINEIILKELEKNTLSSLARNQLIADKVNIRAMQLQTKKENQPVQANFRVELPKKDDDLQR